jgi:pentose-5-phosphate-3-epimerase
MAVDIVPAVLVRSRRELEDGLARLQGVAPWVQVDFVGVNYMGGEENFPRWEEFDFEADLMLPHPAGEVESLVALGAGRVVIHAQNPQAHEALELLQKYRAGDFKIEVGIALRSHDMPDVLNTFGGLYDYVQVMGIDREGAQGTPPDPHHKDIELIAALRAAHPGLCLQADGAVAPRVAELVRAGASRLVIGSAIVSADNPKTAYKSLYNEANGSER